MPSTNNCLESWNRRLKEDRTYRQRIPLSRFLIHCCDWIKTWSNSYKLKITKFVSEPTITLELWTKSYQWVKSKKRIEQPSLDNCFWTYKIPPRNQIAVENYKENFFPWETFDSYNNSFQTFWIVKIPENGYWKICDCPEFFKKFICKHLVGIAIILKLIEVPVQAKNIPIGNKPKRGRPSKAKKALIIQ